MNHAKHRVYQNPDGRIFLELARKPKGGDARRSLGVVRGGVFEIERLKPEHWHRNRGCWHVNFEAVSDHKKYGFDVIFLYAIDGDGQKRNGWVAAETILRDGRRCCYKSTGYEEQISLEPSMLKDTRAEAERAAEPVKKPEPEPEPQRALFATA